MDSTGPTAHLTSSFDGYVGDLRTLLTQPSISATGEGVAECTVLVCDLCQTYGFENVSTVETPGHPAVIAHAAADTDPATAPTILIYGHYDVQPVTESKWESPPFEPTIRPGPDGTDRIYARGAGDNKGQWFAHLCAVSTLRETTGLPMNVTLLLEGEEESGSPNLSEVVASHVDELAADLAFAADGPLDPTGRPHVLMGARGMVYIQIDAKGPNRDLHSGNYGGPVPNPAWELVRLVGMMKDADERITIDGFYDDVRPVGALDREVLDAIPFDADAVQRNLDIAGFSTGPGEGYLEQLLYYPTLNIAGLTSGYGGEGTKTIIPSRAQVKIDMRLVSDQDPDEIYERFVAFIDDHASGTVDLSVSKLGAMAPQRTPLDHPIRKPLLAAVRDAWDLDPILKPTLGGSLPTYVFTEKLGLPSVTIPYANSDENNHSPNENLSIECFEHGIQTTIKVLERIMTDDPELE